VGFTWKCDESKAKQSTERDRDRDRQSAHLRLGTLLLGRAVSEVQVPLRDRLPSGAALVDDAMSRAVRQGREMHASIASKCLLLYKDYAWVSLGNVINLKLELEAKQSKVRGIR
jgi:hypothetical protein